MSRVCLDLPKTKGMILSLEDRILIELFNEKGRTTSEISKKVGLNSYSKVRETLIKMIEKGYVYLRNDVPDNVFYLTKEGVKEVQYRINYEEYIRLYTILEEQGFYFVNIDKCLRDRFYNYYMTGEWNEETLVEQYKLWCESNKLDYYTPITRRLKIQK